MWRLGNTELTVRKVTVRKDTKNDANTIVAGGADVHLRFDSQANDSPSEGSAQNGSIGPLPNQSLIEPESSLVISEDQTGVFHLVPVQLDQLPVSGATQQPSPVLSETPVDVSDLDSWVGRQVHVVRRLQSFRGRLVAVHPEIALASPTHGGKEKITRLKDYESISLSQDAIPSTSAAPAGRLQLQLTHTPRHLHVHFGLKPQSIGWSVSYLAILNKALTRVRLLRATADVWNYTGFTFTKLANLMLTASSETTDTQGGQYKLALPDQSLLPTRFLPNGRPIPKQLSLFTNDGTGVSVDAVLRLHINLGARMMTDDQQPTELALRLINNTQTDWVSGPIRVLATDDFRSVRFIGQTVLSDTKANGGTTLIPVGRSALVTFKAKLQQSDVELWVENKDDSESFPIEVYGKMPTKDLIGHITLQTNASAVKLARENVSRAGDTVTIRVPRIPPHSKVRLHFTYDSQHTRNGGGGGIPPEAGSRERRGIWVSEAGQWAKPVHAGGVESLITPRLCPFPARPLTGGTTTASLGGGSLALVSTRSVSKGTAPPMAVPNAVLSEYTRSVMHLPLRQWLGAPLLRKGGAIQTGQVPRDAAGMEWDARELTRLAKLSARIGRERGILPPDYKWEGEITVADFGRVIGEFDLTPTDDDWRECFRCMLPPPHLEGKTPPMERVRAIQAAESYAAGKPFRFPIEVPKCAMIARNQASRHIQLRWSNLRTLLQPQRWLDSVCIDAFLNVILNSWPAKTLVYVQSAENDVSLAEIKETPACWKICLIPLFYRSHWTFLLIDFSTRSIRYWNSQLVDRQTPELQTRPFRELFPDFTVTTETGPQQRDNSSCGVYSCWWALCCLHWSDAEANDVTQEQIYKVREMIVLQLLISFLHLRLARNQQ